MKKLSTFQQFLIGFDSILLILLILVSSLLYLSVKPKLDGEKSAQKVAQSYAKFSQVSDVETFNGQKTYYSVFGKGSDGSDRVVLVDEDGKVIEQLRPTDGITAKKALTLANQAGASNASKVVLGVYDKDVIWEVTAANGYYLINFKTGELVKKEEV